ncbi:MAG TPA: M1 family aminopeptidase [Alphaproteobacteria bacterium]|nr:M1 family aminopeptidase [Alphaproteobacteria bacterium]
MHIARRPVGRASVLAGFILTCLLPAFAAEKARIKVEDYVIDAQLTPKTHRLAARAKVKFTALEDINVASFELNNALRVSKITDAGGRSLTGERVTQENAVRVQFPATLTKGTSTTLTFDYEGALGTADDSPVEGLKLAYVGEDFCYLLYPGRWFPVVNYGIDRFTATINVSAPAGTTIIGSGGAASSAVKPSGRVEATFSWTKPSFPGTIAAGPFTETTMGNGNVKVYVRAEKKPVAQAYAETATKEFEYFSSLYGAAPSPVLKVVELPDDTVPTWWAPEMALLATRDISEKTNYRLLADSIAHQWWGGTVSPASKDDWWLVEGGARASEMRYVQNAAGEQAFEDATRDMAVGALAYDNIPLAGVGKMDTFSPQFQSLSTDKGGMIFHMLRWVIGEAAFDKTMRELMTSFAGKAITIADLQALAEKNYNDKLTAFFSQWVDGSGAPEFKLKYTVFRIKKGFRIAGQITQDLDLFRMPLELKVDTDGQSEMKRIEVSGTQSAFTVETFGKPRRLMLDPNNWVLKNSPDLKVRIAIRRGQELTAEGSLSEALVEFNKALEVNRNSSLAHYRIAEVFYLQRNYQSAANEYRESINGDGEPRWTEVWSHVQLGKIFDTTGQRERAVNEYRQALQTNDNTQGSLEEARKYLETPFQRERRPSEK